MLLDGANATLEGADAPPVAPRLTTDASSLRLLGIIGVNLLLTIVTLGFYRFWGRTRIREYLWRHTSVLGDRFEYTGTGGELLRGFLRAVLVFAPLFAVAGLLTFFLPVIGTAITSGIYVVSGLLGYAARYGARRYRLSRTRWRGIRGTQTGSPWAYARLAIWTGLLSALTLGLYTPYRRMRLTAFEVNNMYFGDRAPHFDGDGRDLFRAWAITWVLLLPSLGMVWFWYEARAQRYIAAHTTFDGLRFSFPITGASLSRRMTGDLLVILFTLGAGVPLVVLRRLRYVTKHLQVSGSADFAAIAQGLPPAPSTAEGFLDLFNLGDL